MVHDRLLNDKPSSPQLKVMSVGWNVGDWQSAYTLMAASEAAGRDEEVVAAVVVVVMVVVVVLKVVVDLESVDEERDA